MLKKGKENGSNRVSPLVFNVGNMLGPVHCRHRTEVQDKPKVSWGTVGNVSFDLDRAENYLPLLHP